MKFYPHPLISSLSKKISASIKRLKEFEPSEGYQLAFSGGKDSIVLKQLADMANVGYESIYNHTTIDLPEIIYFMRQHHPDVKFNYPEKPFLQKMLEMGFPDRIRRWCCAYYKERGGENRSVLTGIRWEESLNRSNRKMVEFCYKDPTKKYINPIIDWTQGEIWEFIRENNMPYCKLYDEGWKRIGCMFCPMSGKMRMVEAKKYPRWTKLFILYFQKLYNKKKSEGKTSVDRWENGEDMFWWWLKDTRPFHIKDDPFVLFE